MATEEHTKAVNFTPIAKSNDIEHSDGNFTQGCSISPDGLCILTATASDRQLRLYNTPPSILQNDSPGQSLDNNWNSVLRFQEGDSIRGYAWYPLMSSHNPPTCAFLCTSRDQPLHLIDAYTGKLRASYRPHNHLDELCSASCMSFTPDGGRIAASGFRFDRVIQVFDTESPGKDPVGVWKLGKSRRSSDGQRGRVSALSFPGEGAGMFAVGTYSPGSIYLYDDRVPDTAVGGIVMSGTCVVGHGKAYTRKKRRYQNISTATTDKDDEDDHDRESFLSKAKLQWYQRMTRGGVTQLQWSSDAVTLFSAGRRANSVLSWDVRMLADSSTIRGPLSAYARDGDTNQTLEFDLDDEDGRLYVGSRDRSVKVYDVKTSKLIGSVGGFGDAVNGVSVKRLAGRRGVMLAVASGARRFDCTHIIDEEEKKEEGLSQYNVVDPSVPPGTLELFYVD